MHAGHTGKLSYARIWRGSLKDGATLGGSRLGGIYHFSGNDMVKAPEAEAGELVALGRLEKYGDRCDHHARGRGGSAAVPEAARPSMRSRSRRPIARMM